MSILANFKKSISRKFFTLFCIIINRQPFFDWTLIIFKQIAQGGDRSDKCLKNGFLPLPVHFYSPIPDIEDLKRRNVWEQKSILGGIRFETKDHLKLLERLGKKYGKECKWPKNETGNPADYIIGNPTFLFGCAASLYTMVREYKPQRIIEIGSGNSSKIISQAIAKNISEGGQQTEYIIVDPFSSSPVSDKKIKFNKLIKKRVETLDLNFFDQLESGDFLFIDSSHMVKIGSDVNFLYLEVLPRIKSGVFVHCHDIDLSYEYPKCYTTDNKFRQFWTERYLLQAFLAFNNKFEILLPMTYLMKNYQGKFKRLFPAYDPNFPGGRLAFSPSFLIRRK